MIKMEYYELTHMKSFYICQGCEQKIKGIYIFHENRNQAWLCKDCIEKMLNEITFNSYIFKRDE